VLLSLFCGAGGLDLGFEQAEFKVGLALDRKEDSINSYNLNRQHSQCGKLQDLAEINLKVLDRHFGKRFTPTAVIGGPPCQSFSQANVNQKVDDVRSSLPKAYAKLVCALHRRSELDFFVMENVVGLTLKKHEPTLAAIEKTFDKAGFKTARLMKNAKDHGTPQNRPRLFLVGINRRKFPNVDPNKLEVPKAPGGVVRDKLEGLGDPAYFSRNLDMSKHPVHVNHWCMSPKSPKFHREQGIEPGVKGRSFKMLEWDRPSIAVAYGHREVHVHPSGRRRLSVYEAMLLQGFPSDYKLTGNLSSQIDQVSEAVPPPLAKAVALAIKAALYAEELADNAEAGLLEQASPSILRPAAMAGYAGHLSVTDTVAAE